MKKVYNKTTGRYYVGFDARRNLPIWSQAHRPSQAVRIPADVAERIVRQLTTIEPSLDLQIVD